MTQEDKQILLKDLCDRLPYGVIIDSEKYNKSHYRKHYLQRLILVNVLCEEVICIDVDDYPDPKCRKHKLEYCKPYLRPMSSMTEDEWRTMHNCCNAILMGDKRICIRKSEFGSFSELQDAYTTIDWLNAHHFDYRGLIEKGLAMEAPEGMYKF